MRTLDMEGDLDYTESDVANSEMREFLMVLRQALLMIVKYIERKYRLNR